ncbi:MAG: YaiI/YqxD family protein [Candidatus Merdivicinus sp.]|jgi:uncharacterized protein YaiI (UPF0178 family)
MQILVDADSCPVKQEIRTAAKEAGIPVVLITDTSHLLADGYSTVVTVDTAKDSADFKLLSLTNPGDVVVTQDYGVAAMVLGKGALALHPSGLVYTEGNIDQLLLERHLGQKLRRAGKRTPNPRKRTAADNQAFVEALRKILAKNNPVSG